MQQNVTLPSKNEFSISVWKAFFLQMHTRLCQTKPPPPLTAIFQDFLGEHGLASAEWGASTLGRWLVSSMASKRQLRSADLARMSSREQEWYTVTDLAVSSAVVCNCLPIAHRASSVRHWPCNCLPVTSRLTYCPAQTSASQDFLFCAKQSAQDGCPME